MREIVFDTETTGFDPFSGDRLIELGCVELYNKIVTGETYHIYCNPDREVPDAAVKVHGITTEMLSDKPRFHEVASGFIEFIGDAPLVAHNADFDMRFINWELENAGLSPLAGDRFIDTLAMARKKYPGQQNSLDALCKRLGVDNTNRTLHGALLDSEILAEVYLELMGGRQVGLELASSSTKAAVISMETRREKREPRPHHASAEEIAAHQDFVAGLTDPIWDRS